MTVLLTLDRGCDCFFEVSVRSCFPPKTDLLDVLEHDSSTSSAKKNLYYQNTIFITTQIVKNNSKISITYPLNQAHGKMHSASPRPPY